MRNIRRCVTFLVVLSLSFAVQAEDPASIISKAREMQLARLDGVNSYTVKQNVAGSDIVLNYERVDDVSFRLVPQFGSLDTSATEDGGAFLNFDEMQKLAKTARLVGTEKLDGRKAFHLEAENVEYAQQIDDQELSFETFEVWLDTSEYVPLKMRIKGTSTGPEGARPVIVEAISSDYRDVPGSNMYEAHRQVITMSGVIDEAQRKQLEEAQQQMAQFEQQMADMPAGQREMMERMMGPKIEMMKKMAAGDGIEIVMEISSIEVNTSND